MRLSKIVAALLIPFCSLQAAVDPEEGCCEEEVCTNNDKLVCHHWYLVLGSGYAFSRRGVIEVNHDFWDPSDEGYDRSMGSSPFFTVGFGKILGCWFDVDVTYTYYLPFHFQKYQTSAVEATPGFTGPRRSRFFDLEHQNIMFNFTLDPFTAFCFADDWKLHIRPVVGAGMGAGINRVTNFHTIGFEGTGATLIPVGSATSIWVPRTHSSFAWQVYAALRFGHCRLCPFSFDIGYRYYNGGRFLGPQHIVRNTGDGLGFPIDAPSWKGKLRADELYLTINYGF